MLLISYSYCCNKPLKKISTYREYIENTSRENNLLLLFICKVKKFEFCIASLKILRQVHYSHLSLSLSPPPHIYIYIVFVCLKGHQNRNRHECLRLPALSIFTLLPTKQHGYATLDNVQLCSLLLPSSLLWQSDPGLPLR